MYPSDLSDEEWKLICHHFEPKDRRGSGHKYPKKLIVDAILYVVKGLSITHISNQLIGTGVQPLIACPTPSLAPVANRSRGL